MKRQLLLFASLAMATFSFAQEKASFGIRGGVTSSGMQGEAVNNLKNLIDYANGRITTHNRTGVFGGVYANLPLGGNVSIEPGLNYAQKGYEMRGSLNVKGAEFLNANAKAALTSHYIDLPVLVKANFNGLQVFAGPQVSYLAQADLRTTAGVMGFNVFNRKMDATEQFHRWDAGVTGGIGYQFKNGVNLRAAYDHGLTKVDADRNFDSYNRSVKVGVGYNF